MFIIHLKTGQRVQIEESELQLLTRNAKAPLIVFKQGIINPAVIAVVLPDEERKNSARRRVSGVSDPIPELQDNFLSLRTNNQHQLQNENKRH